MKYLPELFGHLRWLDEVRAVDPAFCAGLAALQSSAFL